MSIMREKCDYGPDIMEIDENITKKFSEESPVIISNEEEEEEPYDAKNSHNIMWVLISNIKLKSSQILIPAKIIQQRVGAQTKSSCT